MFEEDAVAAMEELGHQFFVFVNAETERIAILYRRDDGDYGLIEPIVGGEYTTGAARRRPRRESADGRGRRTLRLSPAPVLAGLAGHQARIDHPAPERRDVRVEQREALVDLRSG